MSNLADILQIDIGEEIVIDNDKPTSWADLKNYLGPIKFDWHPWLPKGLLTILASESGTGKSALALRLAGCYLINLPLPDNSQFEGEQGYVLWAEAEAAQAVNLERAVDWKYPIDQILTPFNDPTMDINLEDINHRNALVEKARRPEVKLIIVDSLSGANTRRKESDTEIMRLTRWLATLARDTQKSVLLTHHLRKKGMFDTDDVELDRLRGSSAIQQHAKVIWAIDTPDITNKENKRLKIIKNNLAKLPNPLGMTISDQGVGFGEAPKAARVETQTDKAADILISLLTKQPMKANDIMDEIEQAGISWHTAKIAKEKIKIVSIKKVDGWYWSLPIHE